MALELLKYSIFFASIILLFFTVRYYNKYHKLSSTLLIIIILSSVFQNLEYVLNNDETITIIRQASSISKILFSFSLIIAVIQAGALSINYMYLQLVRKTAWFISFLLMFLGFFLFQTTATDVGILKYNIYFVDIIIVLIILIIGIFSFITKKQYTLLLACISYFIIPLIGLKFIDLHVLFSISQIVFISFLLINEKKSINKSKNILIKS